MKPIIVNDTLEMLKNGGYERLMVSAEEHGFKIPRKTNADRIRAMSNRELAEMLHNAGGNWYSEEYWIEWLKQDAEDGA